MSSLLYALNHAVLWQREIRVWNRSVRAASLDRLVFLCLHRLGWMGGEEDRLLRRLIEPGMTIIDVGANIGLYSLRLASLAGATGCVYSFEPEPNLFAALVENCATNRATNVVPFQYAAGNSNNRATFRRSAFNSGNNSLGGRGGGSVEVEVARVDDVLPVVAAQFIKVDVQGHELAALSGMERVLASSPAVRVLFEFWPSGLRAAKTEPKALLTFFAERGFTIYSIEDSRFTELTDSTLLIQKMGARRYTNLLASRTGVPTS